MTEFSPRLLERYDIRAQLSQGGMGKIYSAWDKVLDRPVAIKTILAWFNDQEHIRDRFYVEARICARFNHPNIVRIYEFVEDQKHPCFVMELLEGRRLSDTILDGKLSYNEIATIISTLARAIAYSHSHGIIHRDLKPENIIITNDGIPKVLDFGIALDEHSARKENNEQFFGSPHYVAPEQLSKDMSLDLRSDIYSLGGILYFCLTKQHPATGATVIEILHKVVNENPPTPTSLAKNVPTELEAITLHALSKNRDDRHSTALELAEELGRFSVGQSVRSKKYSTTEKIKFSIRRSKASFYSQLFAIVAVFIILSLFSATLYSTGKKSILQQLRATLKGIAVSSALMVSDKDVEAVHSKADMKKPESIRLVATLERIKNANPNIEFVYVARKSSDPKLLEFVSENDLYYSDEKLDLNHDGEVDDLESPSYPGEIWEDSANIDEVFAAFHGPTAESDPKIVDKWGTALSGYAPILGEGNKAKSVLGIDMQDTQVGKSFEQMRYAIIGIFCLNLGLAIAAIFGLLYLTIKNWESDSIQKL